MIQRGNFNLLTTAIISDPDEEVEFVPRIKSSSDDEQKTSIADQDYNYEDSDDAYIPIIVIRHQGRFPSFLGSFFGNRGSPFDIFGSDDGSEDHDISSDYPSIGTNFDSQVPQFPGFFAQPPPESLCGLLCSILKGFQVPEEDTNTTDVGIDGDFDINNTTYTEKVL